MPLEQLVNEETVLPDRRADTRAGRDSGLKSWLAVMNTALSAIEQTAWQGREIADRALRTLRAIEQGTDELVEESRLLAEEVRLWPARLKRLGQTGWMLTRVTTSYRLWGIRAAFLPERRRAAALEKMHRDNAGRFLQTSLEQGGAFLKIGQLLSSRPDLLPGPWVETLSRLQDQAYPEPFDSVRQAIEQEFGQALEDLFAEFDATPLAAASIGQVHRARLNDGREVAVKVRRPGLTPLIEQDMVLLKLFLQSVQDLLPPTDIDTIAGEIERTVREELDYRNEAHWMSRIGEFLEDVEGVRVPHPVRSLCGRDVLTSEFVHGRKLTTVLDELKANGEESRLGDLLGRLLDVYFRQVLQGGFFQADPHPGNLLVTDNDELILLDFGCTAQLPADFRRGYFEVLQAAMMNDSRAVGEVLMRLGFATRSGNPDTLQAFAGALLDQFKGLFMTIGGQPFDWPDRDALISGASALLEKAEHDPVVKLPAEFIMLARVFGTLGGLFMHYRPKLDVARYLLPYVMPVY